MEKIAMGSIYLADMVQIPGFDCDGFADVSFGDTVPGRELQWVKLKSGLLIADRCACTNISWEDLDKVGFAFGTPVTINGETYLCRCLRVGTVEDEPNEWDTALDEAGEDNDLWHWRDGYFWGQETSVYEASTRSIRGHDSARDWYFSSATFRSEGVGFRPALEYLGPAPCSPDTLLGKKAKVYCSDGVTIEGCLVGFSDYDVILETNSPIPAGYPWITKEGNSIVINRRNIGWLKEG